MTLGGKFLISAGSTLDAAAQLVEALIYKPEVYGSNS
jgi:hypothetical protein